MSAAMELVQHQVLDYIRISFLIADHTKFVPDCVFSKVAKTYSCSDVFNIAELASVTSNYSSVVIDDGDIVKTWRKGTEEKYAKLPRVRSRHDFIIVRHPATNIAAMKVCDCCYDGQFEETSLKVSKGHVPTEMAMLTALDTHKRRERVKSIFAKKLRMYSRCTPNLYQLSVIQTQQFRLIFVLLTLSMDKISFFCNKTPLVDVRYWKIFK